MKRTLLALALLSVVSWGCKKKPPADEKEDDQEVIVTSPSGTHCGTERWPVKTGTDSQASAVDIMRASDTVIATLTGYPAPPSAPQNSRVAPQETTVWRLRDVTLTGYKAESDSDFHLVVSDGQRTMIVEIPDPNCVGGGSPFTSMIKAARAAFLAHHTPGSWQTTNETISVIGAGFFDAPHGQTGVAPNAIELHPVLGICFGAHCDPGGGAGSSSSSSGGSSSGASSGSSSGSGSSSTSSGGGSTCEHDLCTVGTKLTPSCDPCVKSICGQDAYCCRTKWTATCVSEVASICSRTCN